MTDAIGFAIDDGIGYLRLSGSLRHDTAGELDTGRLQAALERRAEKLRRVVDRERGRPAEIPVRHRAGDRESRQGRQQVRVLIQLYLVR